MNRKLPTKARPASKARPSLTPAQPEVEVVELCSVLGCGLPSTNDKTAPWGYCAAHTPAGDQ
jgi:hypothetical protein